MYLKTKNNRVPVRCWRCGRIIYENIKTGRTGCKNSKCGRLPMGQ